MHKPGGQLAEGSEDHDDLVRRLINLAGSLGVLERVRAWLADEAIAGVTRATVSSYAGSRSDGAVTLFVSVLHNLQALEERYHMYVTWMPQAAANVIPMHHGRHTCVI